MGFTAISNLLALGPALDPRDAFADGAPSALAGRQSPVRLYVERRGRSGTFVPNEVIDWRSIDWPMDGADKTAILTVGGIDPNNPEAFPTPPNPMPGIPHFVDVLAQLHPDRRILLVQVAGKRDRQVLFTGYPQPTTIQWGPDRQSMSITCICEAQDKLRHGPEQQITGRFMRYVPGGEWNAQMPDAMLVGALPAVFNPRGRPNKMGVTGQTALGLEAPDGDTHRLFLFSDDDYPGAGLWSYCDALRYVCFWYVLSGGNPVDVADFMADTASLSGVGPRPSSRDPFERRITARCADDVSIQSVDAETAIVTLCERAGLHCDTETVTEPSGRVPVGTDKLRVFAVLEHAEDIRAELDRSMRQPRRFDVPRDIPFTDYGGYTTQEIAQANASQGGTLTIDPRVITAPHFLGGYLELEATFLLRPAWIPHPQLDDVMRDADPEGNERRILAAIAYWETQFPLLVRPGETLSVYDSTHPNHYQVAKVFREWIFPDDPMINRETYDPIDNPTGLGRVGGAFQEKRYSVYVEPDEPGSDGKHGGLVYTDVVWGGGLARSVVDTWLPRRRRFRNTIGRQDKSTTNTTPIVRIHFGTGEVNEQTGPVPPAPNDPGWVVVTGGPEILDDRAGIRLPHPNILSGPPFVSGLDARTAIRAYIERDFWVSVTATVRGDARMTYRPTRRGSPVSRVRAQFIDLGVDRYQRRMRGWGLSHLDQIVDDEPAFSTRDDQDRFERDCDHMADAMAGARVAGTLSLFYLDGTYAPGDSFGGISGLGIKFQDMPHVERVRHINTGDGYRTDLVLTDARHAPEVNG